MVVEGSYTTVWYTIKLTKYNLTTKILISNKNGQLILRWLDTILDSKVTRFSGGYSATDTVEITS